MRRFVRQPYTMKIYNEADVLVWRTDTITFSASSMEIIYK